MFTIVTILYDEERAGTASIWLIDRDVDHDLEYVALYQEGFKFAGPVDYVVANQIENGLFQLFERVKIPAKKLVWMEE